MGIREDAEDLKMQIKKSIDVNNKAQVLGLLKQAFSLCETLKGTLQTCSEGERKDLKAVLQDLRDFVGDETVRLSKKAGMSEDEFTRFNENPDNFSKEQWKAMQEIRQMFSKQTKEIRTAIRTNPMAKEAVKEENAPTLKLTKSTNEAQKTPKGLRRSKWVKS